MKTDISPRELDAMVAEKIFGFRWYDFTHPSKSVIYEFTDKRPNWSWKPSQRPNSSDAARLAIDNAHIPHYSTDASADYSVLSHIRKNWRSPALAKFTDALMDIWHTKRGMDAPQSLIDAVHALIEAEKKK